MLLVIWFSLGSPVRSWELDSMLLMGPCQLEIFYASKDFLFPTFLQGLMNPVESLGHLYSKNYCAYSNQITTFWTTYTDGHRNL